MARHPVMKMILHDFDSDDELEMVTTCAIEMNKLNSEESSGVRRGSIQGHSVILRNLVQGNERLYRDYFAQPPIYPLNLFRRRFQMNRTLFLCILFMVENYDPYFVQTKNAVGIIGLSSLQKMTAVVRMLSYGVAANAVDDYVRIGESITIESLKIFVRAVVGIFSNEYLRSPNNDDIARLLAMGTNRGFPGMLGSIDCTHWKWKNCPATWEGMSSSHIH